MKEDRFKELMQKSTLETSDDFINSLMDTIEVSKHQKSKFWNSFSFTITITTILILLGTGMLYKLLRQEQITIDFLEVIPATPLFIVVTAILLYALNSMIRIHSKLKTHV